MRAVLPTLLVLGAWAAPASLVNQGCSVLPAMGKAYVRPCSGSFGDFVKGAIEAPSAPCAVTVRFALEPFTVCTPLQPASGNATTMVYAHPRQPYASALWLDFPAAPSECNFRVAGPDENPCGEELSAKWTACTGVRQELLAQDLFTSEHFVVLQLAPFTALDLDLQAFTVAHESINTLFDPFFDIPPYLRLAPNTTERMP